MKPFEKLQLFDCDLGGRNQACNEGESWDWKHQKNQRLLEYPDYQDSNAGNKNIDFSIQNSKKLKHSNETLMKKKKPVVIEKFELQ